MEIWGFESLESGGGDRLFYLFERGKSRRGCVFFDKDWGKDRLVSLLSWSLSGSELAFCIEDSGNGKLLSN